MRIANINATGGDSCPSGWKKITSPTRACRAPSDNAGCYSAHFTTYNIPYSRICEMVVGYQNRMHFALVLQLTSSCNIRVHYIVWVKIPLYKLVVLALLLQYKHHVLDITSR